MRFILLENSLGVEVFIPNRSVTNVINYPSGYVRCIVDVLLVGNETSKDAIIELVTGHVSAVAEQFPGVLIYPPTVEGQEKTSIGNEYLRIKFRIWPGRGAPIEAAFKQSLVQTIKKQQPDYSDWMVAVNYEVERVERRSSGSRKNRR
jgi:hypothetical protein